MSYLIKQSLAFLFLVLPITTTMAASPNYDISASVGNKTSRYKTNGSVSQLNRPELDERNRARCAMLQRQKLQLQAGKAQRGSGVSAYGNADPISSIENEEWSLGCKYFH